MPFFIRHQEHQESSGLASGKMPRLTKNKTDVEEIRLGDFWLLPEELFSSCLCRTSLIDLLESQLSTRLNSNNMPSNLGLSFFFRTSVC